MATPLCGVRVEAEDVIDTDFDDDGLVSSPPAALVNPWVLDPDVIDVVLGLLGGGPWIPTLFSCSFLHSEAQAWRGSFLCVSVHVCVRLVGEART